MFCSFSLEHDPISYWKVLDESGNFLFSVLVNEDKGVMFGIFGIVLVPSFPRMH